MVRKLGSNVSPATLLHALKALAVVDTVRPNFLKMTRMTVHYTFENKDFHTVSSIKKELDMIQ